MAAPDTDKELEQPRDATRKVKRAPLCCGISAWGVILLAGLVLVLVDHFIVSRPGADHRGEFPYYLVIVIIAVGIVASLCLSGLIIALGELASSGVSKEQLKASLWGLCVCLSPKAVTLLFFTVLYEFF